MHSCMSFSKTSNSTRPSDSCYFEVFEKLTRASTSYPGLFASAVGRSAKKALASAGLFCNLIGQ